MPRSSYARERVRSLKRQSAPRAPSADVVRALASLDVKLPSLAPLEEAGRRELDKASQLLRQSRRQLEGRYSRQLSSASPELLRVRAKRNP